MKKDFLSITDVSSKELQHILILARELKQEFKQQGYNQQLLKNKSLVMMFEKPSLRTRLSFELGMNQLGGSAVYLAPSDIGLGVREPIKDIAKVTGNMADGIMARTFTHKVVEDLAYYTNIPVINGLSDAEHPCQTLADLLTIWEVKKKVQGLQISFIGDGNNNVTHSLCLGAAMLGIHFVCAAPKEYMMQPKVVEKAKKIAEGTGSLITETDDPYKAAKNADIMYTDTWVSMGNEEEKQQRLNIFKPYQINQPLMQLAKPEAIFMHDMPAYRGNEVTSDVIDGNQSVMYQQAENRLHAQKALLIFLLKELVPKTAATEHIVGQALAA